MAFHEACYAEVEARIIDEYDHIGLPLPYVGLAHCHVAHDGAQMEQHGYEAHVGQFAVVAHTGSAHILHHVAAKEAELCLWVGILKLTHEV